MGVFDFVKDAGNKVGLSNDKKKKASLKDRKQKAEDNAAKAAAASKKANLQKQAAARKAAAAQRSAASAKKNSAAALREIAQEEKKAESLEAHVAKLGLRARALDVKFDDGVATITGTAGNAAMREKIILAVGNVKGVSKVNDRMKTAKKKAGPVPKNAAARVAAKRRRAAAASAQTFHTVKSGDTLSKLAKKYLGDANRYPEIFKANQPMLTNPDKIAVGQSLRIPRK